MGHQLRHSSHRLQDRDSLLTAMDTGVLQDMEATDRSVDLVEVETDRRAAAAAGLKEVAAVALAEVPVEDREEEVDRRAAAAAAGLKEAAAAAARAADLVEDQAEEAEAVLCQVSEGWEIRTTGILTAKSQRICLPGTVAGKHTNVSATWLRTTWCRAIRAGIMLLRI